MTAGMPAARQLLARAGDGQQPPTRCIGGHSPPSKVLERVKQFST